MRIWYNFNWTCYRLAWRNGRSWHHFSLNIEENSWVNKTKLFCTQVSATFTATLLLVSNSTGIEFIIWPLLQFLQKNIFQQKRIEFKKIEYMIYILRWITVLMMKFESMDAHLQSNEMILCYILSSTNMFSILSKNSVLRRININKIDDNSNVQLVFSKPQLTNKRRCCEPRNAGL